MVLVNTTTGVLAGGGAIDVLVIEGKVGIDADAEDNMDIEEDEDDAEPEGAPVGKAVFKLLLPVGKIPDKRSEPEDEAPPRIGGRDKPNKPPLSLVVSFSFGFAAWVGEGSFEVVVSPPSPNNGRRSALADWKATNANKRITKYGLIMSITQMNGKRTSFERRRRERLSI
jgi:hypothetical protein